MNLANMYIVSYNMRYFVNDSLAAREFLNPKYYLIAYFKTIPSTVAS